MRLSIVDLSGLAWRKSSRSGAENNDACVEVAFTHAVWRKSSHSGAENNSACVEVAFAGPAVAVRDSKSPATGTLAFPNNGWLAFLNCR